MDKEVRMAVPGGELIAYVDPELGQAGIMFRNDEDEVEVDIAYTNLIKLNPNGTRKEFATLPGGPNFRGCNALSIMTYGDPYTEDYTNEETVKFDDIQKSLTSCDAPDSQKM